ncbi:hypothetical protein HZY62_04130 [Maribacter polysiphoniae]|uniref:Uncharacterized protein n=1 Tax=Maribacter polysiphoniae TaxID=429344 RepID=A0A316DYB5_9FLAO|nr:hypothetical protein [Maribacter polysiphoniae]MBD1259764.1 hypothetical protein [Maribacter polysiphoniae]PWK23094.1 hypothetical protein LX92_02423 [Maribacter polysiphoniae]
MAQIFSGSWLTLFGRLFLYGFLVPFILGIETGCSSSKALKNGPYVTGDDQIYGPTVEETRTDSLGLDDHLSILSKGPTEITTIDKEADSLLKIVPIDDGQEVWSPEVLTDTSELPDGLGTKSPVADKIVENYRNAKNKEPGGHCLAVSKRRFMNAYKAVYGHSVYNDLPDNMATKYYSAREVFDNLYVSASGVHRGWRSLPRKYRGKGNAGAIAYAGMGTLVGRDGIWGGELRPGAPVQVWRFKEDYKDVVKGVDKKDFDPYGHSFIFMGYVRNEKNEIVGIRIADQGFQSYRPLIPRDYEVWWAVNLTI